MMVDRLRFVFAALLVLTVGAVGGVYYVVNRVGAAIAPAALDSILPANTDIYVAFNHSSDEQTTLTKLWNTYNRHAGTAAAVTRLQSAYGKEPGVNKSCVDAQRKATSLLNSIGDEVGMAIWLPPDGSKADPQVAVLAQLKIVNLLVNGGSNQLRDIGSTSNDATYRGTQIYKVSARGACGSGAGAGYAALVSNDLVFAQTKAPIERIVDASQSRVATLTSNKDYGATLAALPSSRLLTVYVARRAAALAQKGIDRLDSNGGASSLTTRQQRQLRAMLPNFARPYGMDIAVGADSVSLDTSAIPIATVADTARYATPNGGATVVGGNAILYASQANLAAALKPYFGLIPPGQLHQMEQQTGIDVQRDLLDWMNGEYIIDVNDSVSPLAADKNIAPSLVSGLIGGGSRTASTRASAMPLPGAVEMAWHVDNPAGVQRSLDRILAVVNRQTGSSSSVRLTATTLPDGTVLHTSPSVPGVGYALRGHWLIFSSNLAADAAPRAATLAGDSDYKAVLGRVSGSAALGGVEYLNVTRLLSLVDRWIAYTNGVNPGTIPTADWTRVEPVVAPLHSVLAYSQLSGKRDAMVHLVVTVK